MPTKICAESAGAKLDTIASPIAPPTARVPIDSSPALNALSLTIAVAAGFQPKGQRPMSSETTVVFAILILPPQIGTRVESRILKESIVRVGWSPKPAQALLELPLAQIIAPPIASAPIPRSFPTNASVAPHLQCSVREKMNAVSAAILKMAFPATKTKMIVVFALASTRARIPADDAMEPVSKIAWMSGEELPSADVTEFAIQPPSVVFVVMEKSKSVKAAIMEEELEIIPIPPLARIASKDQTIPKLLSSEELSEGLPLLLSLQLLPSLPSSMPRRPD